MGGFPDCIIREMFLVARLHTNPDWSVFSLARLPDWAFHAESARLTQFPDEVTCRVFFQIGSFSRSLADAADHQIAPDSRLPRSVSPDLQEHAFQVVSECLPDWFIFQIGSARFFLGFFACVLVVDIARLGVRQIRLVIVQNARLTPKPDWD